MGAIGTVIGGPRVVVEALLEVLGCTGLLAMPGFSTDAYFPPDLNKSAMSSTEVYTVEAAVPGFDSLVSPTAGMGIIAETFRTWPGTERSEHPTVSICINGNDAKDYTAEHSLEWATGKQTPLGKLIERNNMKVLLIGVGWNRCSALHTAETLAETRRTKVRRFKHGGFDGPWMQTPDVADDMDRLFPSVGAAFEQSGAVQIGSIGKAESRLCSFAQLVEFARKEINRANLESGDRH
jgi:aminoglycoside 3-N-acetyltransferase